MKSTNELKDLKTKESFLDSLKNLDLDFLSIVMASTISAIFLILLNITYVKKLNIAGALFFSNVINILALTVFLVPPTVYKYTQYLKVKEIEEKFPLFMRNVVEGLRSGMDLHRSFIYAARSSYGALDPYIKKMNNELSWGIPFNVAIINFAKRLKNPVINRVVATILEAYRSGGNLANVMEAVTKSTFEIEKIKKERSASIHGQMVQGYVVFLIFIAVMVGMTRFLIPALSESSGISGGAIIVDPDQYREIFKNLATIQGIFAGLVIGKLAEGRISAGSRHAIILGLIAYSIMSIGA